MALTRAAFLPWYASKVVRGMGGPLAAWLITCMLSACAAGVEDGGFQLDDLSADDAASIVPAMMPPPSPEAGVILPPAQGGPVPIVPVLPTDAGTGTTRDTGTSAPRDAGTSTPVNPNPPSLDAGSQPPLDAGTQPPRDAGTQPVADAGGGTSTNMCSSAPAYPTSTECGKCTCMRCATQVTSCAASSDSAKNTQCLAVRSCAEKNACTGQACYCGSSLLCLNPDGPCRQEIEAAAGGSDVTVVQEASMNPESPLGRSVAVGECQLQNCRRECGL